jgi:hypothetical protein
MYFRKYGGGTDWSGGGAHEVGFSDGGNIWHRYGSSTTWGTWYKIWDTANLTNLNQLTNGPGYITSYSETSTLSVVMSRGNSTGYQFISTTSTPFSFQYNSNTGTYNQTTIYANQNNTSANTANGIFIERGRLTDSASAEVRYFVIGARGGAIQWQVDGSGNTSQTGSISAAGGTITGVTGFGSTGGASDQGIGIYYQNYASGYGRIRFYQSDSNHQTIHAFSASWQSGTLASASSGAININGQNGVTFGGWNVPDAYITTGGSAWFRYDVTAYSDSRVKENVLVIDNAIQRIKSISGVTFTRNDREDKEQRHAGVIAQEVLKVLPEVVTQDTEGMYSVSYGNMAGLFIEAIKEQQIQIEDQALEIRNLKALVGSLLGINLK